MKEYQVLLNKHFTEVMLKNGKLFRAAISTDVLWEIYLEHFQEGEIFRSEENHDCRHCNNFIRRYGNIISVNENGETVTLFDFEGVEEYDEVNRKLNTAIKECGIETVFMETFESLNSLPYEKTNKNQNVFRLGFLKNDKVYTVEEAAAGTISVNPNQTYTFHHFYLDIPQEYVDKSGQSLGTIISEANQKHESLAKGLTVLDKETLEHVIDLIDQGSILDAEDQVKKLEDYIKTLSAYNEIKDTAKEAWLWIKSSDYPYFRLHNELIGVLCSDIKEKGVDVAVNLWNIRVDPVNYARATKPITETQKREAIKLVKELGYEESFNRRLATIDDIKTSEIKHINSGDGKNKGISIFDQIPTSKSSGTKVGEGSKVGITKFMDEVLPGASVVEILFDYKHIGNLVTLTTTTNDAESKRIFGWDNNYSWSFKDGLSGKSRIAEAVKNAGGRIDTPVRATISWNESGNDTVDFDIHATEPDGTRISFMAYRGVGNLTNMTGNLDVDMIRPKGLGVENITWSAVSEMKDGDYHINVHNYDRGTNTGFKLEIEILGKVYNFSKSGNIKGPTSAAIITKKGNDFTVKGLIDELTTKRNEWGIETGEFHKVNLVSASPNYWGENAVGKKQYFFFIEGCASDRPIKPFHPDQLKGDLKPARKVLEVLSHITQIPPSDDPTQLAGLGFNATVRDEVKLKVDGKLYTVEF